MSGPTRPRLRRDPGPQPLANVLRRTGLELAPQMAEAIDEVLVTGEQIRAKLAELAARLDVDYAGRQLLLIGVLKGAFVLIADLARHLTVPVSIDFMAVSSYGSTTRTSGVVRIIKDLDIDIEGRHVLLVEDIVDSGLTLNYLLRNLRSRRPASLEVLALLTKPSQQRVDLPICYQGFAVPNVFVVGYGLDFDELYRNLPFIATLKPEVYS